MKIVINGKNTPYFGRAVIYKTLDSLVDTAVLTFQNSKQARDVFTPGASCSIKSDDESVTYIKGVIECRELQSNGQIIVTAMDSLWPALKYTPNGKTEIVNTTTRNLIQELLSPFGIQAAGLAGVIHKKAVLNVDESVVNAIYRYADRAGVFVRSNNDGAAEISAISTPSTTVLDQKVNLFGFGRTQHYMPPKTQVFTTESDQFGPYAESKGDSEYTDSQVCAGVMSISEAKNLASIRNWRIRCENDCLSGMVTPAINILPGQSVSVKCPSAEIEGTRTVRRLTIDIDCRAGKMEKRVELVPDYEQ